MIINKKNQKISLKKLFSFLSSLFTLRRGFTLVEVLLTIGILGFIFAIGLPISWDFYTRYQFNSEVSTFVSILESARNSAMVNLNESSHGVYIDDVNGEFVVFQGSSYAGRDVSEDKMFPRETSIVIAGDPALEIVFTALSGQTIESTFTISHPSQSPVTVDINSEGTIAF